MKRNINLVLLLLGLSLYLTHRLINSQSTMEAKLNVPLTFSSTDGSFKPSHEAGGSAPLLIPLESGLKRGSSLILKGSLISNEFGIQLSDFYGFDTFITFYSVNITHPSRLVNFASHFNSRLFRIPLPGSLKPFSIQITFGAEGLEISLNGHIRQQVSLTVPSHLTLVQLLTILCMQMIDSSCVQISSVAVLNAPQDHSDAREEILKVFTSLPPALESQQQQQQQQQQQNQKHQNKRRRPRLFVGILSSPGHVNLRNGSRKTWMRHPSVEAGEVVIRFFVGNSRTPLEQEILGHEQRRFGDLVFVDMEEHYFNTAKKTAAIVREGVKSFQASFILKTDDDTVILLDRFLQFLQKNATETRFFSGGKMWVQAPVMRDIYDLYYVPLDHYPQSNFPLFFGGYANVLSSDLAAAIVEDLDGNQLKYYSMEDVGVGIWLDQISLRRDWKLTIVQEERFISRGCAPDGIIINGLSEAGMSCLWGKFRAQEDDICCKNGV